jgi:SAM-dependent methyltransferase
MIELTGQQEMERVEQWAADHFRVRDIDSVAYAYSGDGPPSWRQERPEITGQLDAGNAGHWWWLCRLEAIRRHLTPEMRLLDIGCGPGWPSIPLARHVRAVEAVDASELAVKTMGRHLRQLGVPNLAVRKADASRLPFEEATFEAVVAVDLLNVVSEPSAAVREMRRVLKPGGTFVVVLQNWAAVLQGDKERHWRCLLERNGQQVYNYHLASLVGLYSVDLSSPIKPGSKLPGEPSAVPAAPKRVVVEQVLRELNGLRGFLDQPVTRYRTSEFISRNLLELFAAAGFGELQLQRLHPDVCGSFASAHLSDRRAPVAQREWTSMTPGILSSMNEVAEGKALELCLAGRKIRLDA